MGIKFFPLIILFFCWQLKAASKADDQQGKEERILNLIEVEIEQIQKVKNRGIKLDYRLFELQSEQVQLNRKIESRKFLASNDNKNKKSYYRKSEAMYKKVQQKGQDLLRKYKTNSYTAEIYFTLASNIIEVQNDIERDQKAILDYLMKAKSTSRKPELTYNINVKIAEIYYTVKDYKQAEIFYKDIINKKTDPWYTKNLHNYSWVLFQLKKYDSAIKLAHTAYEASKQKKYIDIRDQLDEAFSYFYVFNKNPKRAIEVHASNHQKPKDHLLKVVTLSNKYISSDVAMEAEAQSRSVCAKREDIVCQYLLSVFKLGIYKEAKSYQQHYVASQVALKEFKTLSTEEKKQLHDETLTIIDNLSRQVEFLTSMAYKDHYLFTQDKEVTYKKIIGLLDTLIQFNPELEHEYRFLQAELSYKELKYKVASQYYIKSFQTTAEDKKPEFFKKLFPSILDLANNEKFNNDEFFEKAYKVVIGYNPKDETNSKHYEALFKFYHAKSDFKSAEKTLDYYVTNLPKFQKNQQEMSKTLINSHIERKNASMLVHWVKKVQKGYLDFPAEFIKKNILILGGVLFDDIEFIVKKGDYAAAKERYKKIYSDHQYPREIKSESAFRIALLTLKQKQTKDSYQWLVMSKKIMTSEETEKKLDDFLSISLEYANLQDLVSSSKLSSHIIVNYCHKLARKSLEAEVYRLNHWYVTHREYGKAQGLQETALKCSVSSTVIGDMKKQLIGRIIKDQKYEDLEKVNYQAFLDYTFDKLYFSFWNFSHDIRLSHRHDKIKKYLMFFINKNKNMLKPDQSNFLTQFHQLKQFEKSVNELRFKKLSFVGEDVDSFANNLEVESGKLTVLKDQAELLMKSVTHEELYVGYLALQYFAYEKFQAILQTIDLSKGDKEIAGEIKKNIVQIANKLNEEKSALVASKNKLVSKNPMLLSYFKKYFTYDADLVAMSFERDRKVRDITQGAGL